MTGEAEVYFPPHSRQKGECLTCFRNVHLSDYMFAGAFINSQSDIFLPVMLTLEKILMQGLILQAAEEKDGLQTTIFLQDGPLSIFRAKNPLARYLLKQLQASASFPVLLGLEKTGEYHGLMKSSAFNSRIEPGAIAMVTSQAVNVLAHKPPATAHRNVSGYGKRFIYRTLKGDKVFIFTTPPRVGLPLWQEGNEACDEWETYPHLQLICEFLEENQTQRYGVKEAALRLIAEANHGASLPTALSTKFLEDLLKSS